MDTINNNYYYLLLLFNIIIPITWFINKKTYILLRLFWAMPFASKKVINSCILTYRLC